MNILLDKLQSSVIIGGAEYAINADFRTSLNFKETMDNEEIEESEKVIEILKLYYPIIPENPQEAIDKIFWFYTQADTEEKGNTNSKGTINIDEIISYKYDSKYIYSDFLREYNIDLQENNIHWWKFKTLFDSLSEESEIKKIMGIRAMSLKDIEDDKMREHYKKMKEIYKLPTKNLKNEIKKSSETLNRLLQYQ